MSVCSSIHLSTSESEDGSDREEDETIDRTPKRKRGSQPGASDSESDIGHTKIQRHTSSTDASEVGAETSPEDMELEVFPPEREPHPANVVSPAVVASGTTPPPEVGVPTGTAERSAPTPEGTSGARVQTPPLDETVRPHQDAPWETVKSRGRKNRPVTRAPARDRDNDRPVFFDHPVIIENKHEGGETRLRSLDWNLADLLSEAVGSVRTIKPMGNRVLIGCVSDLQQSRLAKLTNLGKVPVRCTIPVPTVMGVVSGIPQAVSVSEFLTKIESVSGDAGTAPLVIRDARRLTLRDGKPSQAVRVTFVAHSLPLTMKVNKREYGVRPFVAQVIRCYRCQRFGHYMRECRAKKEVCPTCGSPGHAAAKCKATERRCVNCRGAHSAGYQGCPARKDQARANLIRGTSYLPKAAALWQAKTERSSLEGANKPVTAPRLSQRKLSWPPRGGERQRQIRPPLDHTRGQWLAPNGPEVRTKPAQNLAPPRRPRTPNRKLAMAPRQRRRSADPRAPPRRYPPPSPRT
jgi:hypothetical protein